MGKKMEERAYILVFKTTFTDLAGLLILFNPRSKESYSEFHNGYLYCRHRSRLVTECLNSEPDVLFVVDAHGWELTIRTQNLASFPALRSMHSNSSWCTLSLATLCPLAIQTLLGDHRGRIKFFLKVIGSNVNLLKGSTNRDPEGYSSGQSPFRPGPKRSC